MTLWWLSFADHTGFLGATVVEAIDVISAVKEAHRLGTNPGGDVRGVEVPEEARAEFTSFIGRLATAEELRGDARFTSA